MTNYSQITPKLQVGSLSPDLNGHYSRDELLQAAGELSLSADQLREISAVCAKADLLRNQTPEPPKPLWDVYPLSKALEPKPPRVYIVDGILIAPSLSIWYGAPGSLKTMAMLDMGLSISSGKPWLSGRPGGEYVKPFDVLQAPVLWIDQDSGQDEIERRMAAIVKAKGIDAETTPFYYVSFPIPGLMGDDQKLIDGVIALVQHLGAKLIVVDNLNSICGNADENSPLMGHVVHGLRQIAERATAAVAVIHHPPRGELRIRGHSSIDGKLDRAISIQRETPDAVDITFRGTKSRQGPLKPFGAYFAYTSQENDPRELEAACFFGTGESERLFDDLKAVEKAKFYIRELAPHKMNQTELIDALKPHKIGANSIRQAIDKMAGNGELFVESGDRNAKLCSLVC